MSARDQALQKHFDRWYDLNPHPVQEALVNDPYRFKIVPAGRRSGKTERAKRKVVKEAMRVVGPYFIAAPTRDQVKRIYWEDLKLMCFSSILPRNNISESELTIKLPNGSSIVLIGLDKPARIEGAFWKGGIVDEMADCKPDSWPLHISPALDTYNPTDPDYRAWCWLIGVPDGLGGMAFYEEMATMAKKPGNEDWGFYTWPSSDILPPDVIEAAKRRMTKDQFNQEYGGMFVKASSLVYHNYSHWNEVSATIKPYEQLLWMHDFNYSPMSSAIGVIRDEVDLYLLDEIILESATARQSAIEFCERYRKHKNRKVLIYGDPAGRAGEKHGHASDYLEIEEVLSRNAWIFERRVKKQAPNIITGQNAVRRKILNAANEITLFVNPHTAPWVHEGLRTLQVKPGSTFIEDDKNKYQHVTSAIRYCCDYEWPVIHEGDNKVIELPGSIKFPKGRRG